MTGCTFLEVLCRRRLPTSAIGKGRSIGAEHGKGYQRRGDFWFAEKRVFHLLPKL